MQAEWSRHTTYRQLRALPATRFQHRQLLKLSRGAHPLRLQGLRQTVSVCFGLPVATSSLTRTYPYRTYIIHLVQRHHATCISSRPRSGCSWSSRSQQAPMRPNRRQYAKWLQTQARSSTTTTTPSSNPPPHSLSQYQPSGRASPFKTTTPASSQQTPQPSST